MQYLIVGTRGAASCDVFARRIKRWEFSDSEKGLISKWVEDLSWNPKEDQCYYHNTRDQALDIVRRVSLGLPPATPARDAYKTMRLVDAAERSANLGKPIAHSDVVETVA